MGVFIIIEKIGQVVSLINSSKKDWFTLRPELVNILGTDSCKDLLNDFETQLGSFPQKKLPHYSMVFYLALVILQPHDKLGNLALEVKHKESYRMMKTGLRIFLSSKSERLKYEVELTADRYRNKYEFIDFFSGYILDYEMDMREYLLLFELIYNEDRQSFCDLLALDRQNVIFLCLLLNGRISFHNDELIPFLNSEDLLKANGAFFYIMNDFSYWVRKLNHEESEENEKGLQQKIIAIREILEKLPQERRLHLILNYILVEKSYPSYFADELKSSRISTVVTELECKELDNLFKLKDIYKVLEILRKTEVEQIFALNFTEWVKENANPYIWERCEPAVKHVMKLLSHDVKDNMLRQLDEYNHTLHISTFDQQVRQNIFRREEIKSKIIATCLSEKLR
ncbi:hypothetical protein AB1L07_20970 [Niallia alba]|uniref:hypothetical protein n=1 Tax=Niallia alba TaxID=2729105 RepID=UPI0039A00E2C